MGSKEGDVLYDFTNRYSCTGGDIVCLYLTRARAQRIDTQIEKE